MTRNTQFKIFYLLLITFVLTIGNSYGQERTVEKVDTNLYKYTVKTNGKVHQKGYYKLIDGIFEEHSYWRNEFGTVAYFENGKMIWIKPNGKRKYTYREMELNKLRRKVERLEAIVALRDKP